MATLSGLTALRLRGPQFPQPRVRRGDHVHLQPTEGRQLLLLHLSLPAANVTDTGVGRALASLRVAEDVSLMVWNYLPPPRITLCLSPFVGRFHCLEVWSLRGIFKVLASCSQTQMSWRYVKLYSE